jgi:hypothetical protein
MKKQSVFSILLVCLLAFGLVLISCDDTVNGGSNQGDIQDQMAGTWAGTISGYNCSIVLIGSGWTFYMQGKLEDAGTYTMMPDGKTATLYSTTGRCDIGIAVVINSNTMNLTLNTNTNMPGTYIFTRR